MCSFQCEVPAAGSCGSRLEHPADHGGCLMMSGACTRRSRGRRTPQAGGAAAVSSSTCVLSHAERRPAASASLLDRVADVESRLWTTQEDFSRHHLHSNQSCACTFLRPVFLSFRSSTGSHSHTYDVITSRPLRMTCLWKLSAQSDVVSVPSLF